MRDPKLARKAACFLVLFLIVQTISVGILYKPVSGQDPEVVDIGGGRRTATWNLEDPANYTTDNVTIQGGEARLTLNNYSWLESEQSDYLDGTWDGNVTLTPEGNITLASDDTNLVSDGDFATGMDWICLNGSGGHAIAERDGTEENAHLHHSAPQGALALIDDFEYASNYTNWTASGVGADRNFNSSGHLSSGAMDVVWTPTLPIDEGGVRKQAPTVWDWSGFNRLSLWANTEYPGPDTLQVHINIIDTSMNSWSSTKRNVIYFPPGWRMYWFDINGFTGDISQIDILEIFFDGISGDGFTQYTVTIDDVQVYYQKTFGEGAYCNQTFTKTNVTNNGPGNVMLSFDVFVEDNANLVESYLNLTVSNTTSSYRWEKASVVAPYSSHVIADLSWLMVETGTYNISLQLWIRVNTRLETRYSARFDNITLLAPNRSNGTYFSEPHDTASQSLWSGLNWTEGPPDAETLISVFTRTGNSTNTADGSWSNWQSAGPMIASPSNRYIQYRIDLNTTNASKAPVLLDIEIDFCQYSSIGFLETDDFTVPDLHIWEEFSCIDSIDPESSISYSYSSDAGGTWSSISNGSNLSSVTNKTLKFKAEIMTTNTTLTSSILEMKISYQYVGPLDHIHMSDDYIDTTAGSFVNLSAYGHDSLHRSVSFTQKWETTDPVGNVSPFGNYTAGMVGTWMIYCNNSDDSVSNHTVVNVSAGSLVRIGVDPWDPGTLTTDDQLQFNATGYDVMENIVPVSPNWTVVGVIGTVDPGPSTTTVFDATTVGTGVVVANDGMGHVNQTNSFSVVAGQLASVLVTPPSVNLQPSQSTQFHAQGKDGDGNNVTLTSATWTTNAGTITGSNSTDADFTAQSTEMLGGYIRATQGSIFGDAIINVDDGDGPPVIQGIIPDQHTYEDYGSWSLDLTAYASDAEDDVTQLKWRVTGDDSTLYSITGENIPGNHLLTFTTKKDEFGNDDVKFWLIDTKGQSTSQAVWINITPVNDKPTIFAPDKEYVRFDVPRIVDYSQYIRDVDNSHGELTLATNDIDHTTVNGLQVRYEYPESMVGKPIFVILTVSDGKDYAQHVVEIVVSGNYPPRLMTPIADVTMYEDQPMGNVFDLNDHFEDPDDTQLTFGSLSQKVIVDIEPSGVVSLSSAANWFGDELVIFTATDSSGAVAQDAVLVRVLPVNDPPDIDGLPDLTIHYDVVYNFDVSPYISDIDDLTSDLIINCSDTTNSIVLGTIVSFNYPTITVVDVTITVSDGEYQDSDVMTITVTDNHPPISDGLPDVFFNEDESLPSAFDLDDYFSDIEGDTLTYSSRQTQSFVVVTIGTDNVVSFSSWVNWSGQQVIVFRAEDEQGAFTEDSIIVTVIPVNDAPVIYPVPRQVGEKNKAWLLDMTAYIYDSDNETADLVIQADFEYVTVAGHYLIFNCEESFDLRETTVTVSDGLLQGSAVIEVSVTSYVDPELQMFVWPTALAIVALSLVGLVYWRASRRYIMEDLFVVKRDGKVMVHKTIRTRPDRDEDMFSGMMTAIHAFAEDTFREEGGTLKSFESEDKRVVLEAAKSFYAAAIFAGKEPKWALKSLEEFVQDVETMYGAEIESWSGIMDELGTLPDMVAYFVSKKRYSSGDWTLPELDDEEILED